MSRKSTDLIIIHASATQAKADIGADEIDKWHRARGFFEIGYHYVIRRNGDLEIGRGAYEIGAHVKGLNHKSVGVCMIGGVDKNLQPEKNFTDAQWNALSHLVGVLRSTFPKAKVIGHNEVSDKACPSFDVQEWLARTFDDRDTPLCPECGQAL